MSEVFLAPSSHLELIHLVQLIHQYLVVQVVLPSQFFTWVGWTYEFLVAIDFAQEDRLFHFMAYFCPAQHPVQGCVLSV